MNVFIFITVFLIVSVCSSLFLTNKLCNLLYKIFMALTLSMFIFDTLALIKVSITKYIHVLLAIAIGFYFNYHTFVELKAWIKKANKKDYATNDDKNEGAKT
jgi:hypothetical protein